jgi:allene oxide cyclase
MKIVYLALLVVAAIALTAFVIQDETTMTIHVIEHADTDVVTDTGEEGDTVGDILTFANEVYDEADAEQVGTDNGYCFRTVAPGAWECAWTVTLADGSITVQGPFNDTGDSILAITGGTGAYAGAHGQMTLSFHNEEGTAFDFVYEIIQ